jgi:outer membrane receptor protein involved in Fe transport
VTRRQNSRGNWTLVLAIWLALVPTLVQAGTTGTIAGMVVDTYGEPVAEVTVTVVGTTLSATTDAEGQYAILGIPSGTYEVKASHPDYSGVTVSAVIVSADRTMTLYLQVGNSDRAYEEVLVTAERAPVDLKVTSTQSTLTKEDIENLPVQNLDDVVNLQAGVVDGHFRGGRRGEVQYQVDGVSVNNAFDNSSSMQIDRSLLQEVQVISGTFDAEYGQAMSGVVNAVLKQGTKDFQADAEVFTGGFYFPGREEERRTDDTAHLTGTQNYQVSLSGPVPLPKTTFLISGRRAHFDDFIYTDRRYNPTDVADSTGTVVGTGDGKSEPLGYNDEWSGVVKVTNSALTNSRFSYQALINAREGRPNNYAFRYLPDALSIQRSFSISHGLDWTQILGESTYLDLSMRQNYFSYKDYLYEDPYDPRYDAPLQLSNTGTNGDYFFQGVQTNHYMQKTNTFIFKGSVVSQVNNQNQVKTGLEFSLPKVEFGNDMYFTYGEGTLVRHINEPPDYPGPAIHYPLMGAAYIQDQLERNDLVVRFGARLDYFDARSTVPSDLANPANAIDGAPLSTPRRTTVKAGVSPRLGVAYPIQDQAAIHFAYGHFQQFPSVNTMFANSDYAILERLQAGTISYGIMGNPDVKPEKTVQYEIGYKQVLTQELGFDLTFFYKDIRDLLGVEFISTYTGAEYTRLTNVDFGSITGITLSVDHRQIGPLSMSLDYTWQQALGNASDPSETANRAAAGEDPRPRLVPFNWDQRHTLNLTASIFKPGQYALSAVAKVASGQRYTPQTEQAFGFGASTNSGTKPASFLVDLRAEKFLGSFGQGGVFMRVFNLFDQRYFNGPVYATTGSPYYARFPSPGELVSLADPTRLYQPRRIEFGMRWRWGGE